ncbi:hypothetical protein SANTM175S_06067 [Streptomyces antimycoticus]
MEADRVAGGHYVKVAPNPILNARETCAYRVAVPHLGHGNAPVLRDSSAELLALIPPRWKASRQRKRSNPHAAALPTGKPASSCAASTTP